MTGKLVKFDFLFVSQVVQKRKLGEGMSRFQLFKPKYLRNISTKNY